MRASAALRAAAPMVEGDPCRLLDVRDAAPVAWRTTPDGVYLVGTAATPVGDDQIEIEVRVDDHAQLRLRSAAAAVAWRGHGTGCRLAVSLGAGSSLDWHPQPLIATIGCDHRQSTVVKLQATSRLRWVEEVVLGRHGEAPGHLDMRLAVDVDGVALLRHQLEVGPGAPGWSGPAVVGRAHCVGLMLEVAPDLAPAPTSTATRLDGDRGSSAVLALDGPGRLTVAVAADLPALRELITHTTERIH